MERCVYDIVKLFLPSVVGLYTEDKEDINYMIPCSRVSTVAKIKDNMLVLYFNSILLIFSF